MSLHEAAMKILGIPLRKPKPLELTGACAMSVGIWLAALGMLRTAQVDFGAGDAGGLLLMIAWGCVSTRLGIRVDRGGRHLAANCVVGGLLMATYQVALAAAI